MDNGRLKITRNERTDKRKRKTNKNKGGQKDPKRRRRRRRRIQDKEGREPR